MTLGLLTALWKRPALTRAFLDYWAELQVPGVDLMRVAAYSELTGMPHPGWYYVAHPNEPLTDKWNAGMHMMRGAAPEAVMVMGSDDFAAPEYVQEACRLIQEGADLVIPRQLYLYEAATGRMLRGRFTRVGAGITFSRRLLQQLDWQPWAPGRPLGLENAMESRLRYSRAKYHTEYVDEAVIVDVKTAENMWPFEHYLGKGHGETDAAEVLGALPGLAALLASLNDTHQQEA